MGRYVLRRLSHSLFAMVAILALVFLGGRMIGDPAYLIMGPFASEESLEALRVSLGLHQPLHVQFVEFIGRVFRGDFGQSFYHNQPVLPVVLSRLPATLLLAGGTVLLAHPIAVLLGVVAAWRPGSLVDRIVNVISLGGISIVNFWSGLMLILLFAVTLGWLPTSGYGGLADLRYLILPVLALSLRPLGRLSQVSRSAAMDELSKPYVKMARAKGLRERRTVFVHVLKNASIPMITLAGDDITALLNGIVVIELVFAWPGIGLLFIQSLEQRDLPVIEALIFVIAIMVIIVNLVVDIAYSYLDPRVRYS